MDLRLLYRENYTVNDKIIYRKVSEATTMAYNPENGDMYELNEVSDKIITQLREGKDGESIIQSLLNVYDVDIDTVVEDVSPMLDRLKELGVLFIKQ